MAQEVASFVTDTFVKDMHVLGSGAAGRVVCAVEISKSLNDEVPFSAFQGRLIPEYNANRI